MVRTSIRYLSYNPWREHRTHINLKCFCTSLELFHCCNCFGSLNISNSNSHNHSETPCIFMSLLDRNSRWKIYKTGKRRRNRGGHACEWMQRHAFQLLVTAERLGHGRWWKHGWNIYLSLSVLWLGKENRIDFLKLLGCNPKTLSFFISMLKVCVCQLHISNSMKYIHVKFITGEKCKLQPYQS
jgi:hypothetical protein